LKMLIIAPGAARTRLYNCKLSCLITNRPVMEVMGVMITPYSRPVMEVMEVMITPYSRPVMEAMITPYSWSSSVCFTLLKSKSSPVPRLKISNTSRQVVSKWEVAS